MPVNINFKHPLGGYELANNLETEIGGVAALDAAQGKKLKELIANVVAPQWLEQGATVNIDSKSLSNFVYGISEVTLGTRPYTYGVLLNIRRSNTDIVQMAYSITGNQIATRYSTRNGWSDWSSIGVNVPAFSVNGTTTDDGSYYYHIKDGVQTRLRIYEEKAYLQYQWKVDSNYEEKELTHSILYGSVITNEVQSKMGTIVNKLELRAGIYVITSCVEYSTEFGEAANGSILVNDYQYIINRSTGVGGGGITPSTILDVTSPTTIKLSTYQGSNGNKTLSKNILTAVKLS